MSNIERPAFVSDEHLRFLDALQKSGRVNMFGAREPLYEAFPKLSKPQSADVLKYWMESYGERHGVA